MNKKRNIPVFFDPNNRRWFRVKLVALICSLLCGVILVVFLTNIFSYREHDALSSSNFLPAVAKRLGLGWSPIKAGFFVNWDKNSFSSLKAHLDELDVVIGDWLHLSSADGTLKEDNATDQRSVMDFIASNKPETKVLAMVNNALEGDWDSTKLAEMLAQPEARSNAIGKLMSYSKDNRLAGVCVDFEEIAKESFSDYYKFLQELRLELHDAHLLMAVAVPADNDDFDYKKISSLSDYVIVMAYDEHWATSPPGPIASKDWFFSVLRKRQGDVPSEKMILALGSYGYDWKDDEESNSTESRSDDSSAAGGEAMVQTFQEVMDTAIWAQGEIRTDPASMNPLFEYDDQNNKTHLVWMLDAITFFNQMSAAKPLAPCGIALWRLGSEDSLVWKIFKAAPQLNSQTAEELSAIEYDYTADYRGDGEILSIIRRSTTGKREIDFDDNMGLIVSEKYVILPLPYLISLSGSVDRKIALTFDDGPDPEYTPMILDVLKKAQVPATFFVIGYQGLQNQSLLKREFAEGHEIGNHTFTHPNISKISEARLRAEITATDLLLAKSIGRRTRLFRAPFNEDSEPQTETELRPVHLINSLNHEIVGLDIDPHDWHQVSAKEIVRRTVEREATHGGNVLLFHDGGGDRSQTVKALPGIIKAFRDKGFQFVTVSQLDGKTRDEVMPIAQNGNVFVSWGKNLGFDMMNFGQAALAFLFLVGIVLGLARLLFITVIAIVERIRKKDSFFLPDREFPVSVIIPAYNEEKVIRKTIDSLLAARHPEHFEILVIDDGSTDATLQVVKEAYAKEPFVKIVSLPNGGKHAALNYGIAHAEGEIIVTFDADTIVTGEAIVKLVNRFSDPSIGAVAGNAKVGNRINLLTRWQALEYITSQNMDRRALDLLNGITVVPGAIGAWRREVLRLVGGFSSDTLAEDSDLTIMIRKLGYKICYEESAIASTEAPADIKGFIRQRFRWMFGTFQVAWKHIDAILQKKYGWLGFFSLPSLFLHQIFFPLISPVMDIFMAMTLLSAGINRWQHPTEFSPDSLIRILIFYSIFLLADFLAAAIAFILEKKEDKRLLIWLVPQRFFYRQLLYYVAIKSILASLQGRLVGWNKVERKGTVSVE